MPGQERKYPQCPAKGPNPEYVGTDSGRLPWEPATGSDVYYGNAAANEDMLGSSTAPVCPEGVLAQDLSHVPPVAAPRYGNTTLDRGSVGKVVALTFDDGPTPDQLPLILDILDKHGVPATFFINGDQVDSADAYQQLDDIMTRPTRHLIGSHTENHTSKRGDGAASVTDQVERMDDDKIEPFLRPDQPKYVRFPYGDAASPEIATAEGLGYTSVGWDVDTADWCYGESPTGTCNWDAAGAPGATGQQNDMVGYTVDQVEAKDGGIVLLHDKYAYTPTHLEALILRLKAAGYTFTNIDDVEAFPKLARRAQQVSEAAAAPPAAPR